MILKIVLAILLLVVVLAGGAIIKNGVLLFEPPGPGKRLRIYLGDNTARTHPDHPLPELRTRSYNLPVDSMFPLLRQAIAGLGWHIAKASEDKREILAIVSTPWLGFKDDVRIRLKSESAGVTSLHVVSRSRVGRADFGANIAHITALQRELGPLAE